MPDEKEPASNALIVPKWVLGKLKAEAIRCYPKEMFCYLQGAKNRVTGIEWVEYTATYEEASPVNPSPPQGSLMTVHSHLDDKWFGSPSVGDLSDEPQAIVTVWHENGELKAEVYFWPTFRPLEVCYV